MKSTRRWQQLLLNSLAIILGNALYSLAVALFLEPAGLITGGATGIALAFGRLTGLSVSGFLLVFNLAMLVWGWAVLGRAFALNTLASSILSPVFLALWERLLADRVLTEDIFLCTVFATVADSSNLFFLSQNDIFQQIFSTASKTDISDFNVFHQNFSFMCFF